MNTETPNILVYLLGFIFFIMQVLLTIVLSMGAFYFKQLKATIDEHRAATDKRMKEGEERFRKVEENLGTLRAEVYRDYVTKPDLIRMIGTIENKIGEVMELIERLHCADKKKEM